MAIIGSGGLVDGRTLGCNYYAAPNGESTNSGLSPRRPIRIADFWSKPDLPGKTLCLLNGTYTTINNMIDPPTGLSGVSGAPITIRAINEGEVLIDGEFVSNTISFTGNHWFVVEGINLRHGNFALVIIRQPTSNITLRRVVGWDTNATVGEATGITIANDDVTNIILEDVGLFGVMANGIRIGDSANGPIMIRRVYADNQGYMGGSDTSQTAFHPNYSSTSNVTVENSIGRVSYSQQPFSHCFAAGNGYPAGCVDNYRQSGPGARYIFRFRGGNSPPPNVNTHIYGSLGYTLATDRWRYNGIQIGPVDALRAPVGENINGIHIVDTMMFIHPSNSTFNFAQGFHLAHSAVPTGGYDLVATNITSVRGSLGDHIEGYPTTNEWDVTNYSSGTSLAAVQNPWTTTTGANLCFRYVDRVKTTTPLWPWPMNERIKRASIAAAAGYQGPCNTCDWSDAAGTQTTPPARAEIDVTAQVESILGVIPSSCKNSII